MARTSISIAALLALLAGCGDEAYRESVDSWHAGRIERLQAEDGWLTLVGLHGLTQGANTIGTAEDRDVVLNASAPAHVGTLELSADGHRFVPAEGSGVTVDGESVEGPVVVTADDQGEPTMLRVGAVSFYVVARGDRNFLRVKDGDSATRRDFQGVERFPVDPAWRVTARLETEGRPATVPVANVLGQVEEQASPGLLIFEVDGRELSLVPVGEPGQSMFIVFADATSGFETYGGGRFLSAAAPDAEGRVVLDFNRATNPPCCFTPYATCPMPSPENRLPVRVPAGEKVWGEHH